MQALLASCLVLLGTLAGCNAVLGLGDPTVDTLQDGGGGAGGGSAGGAPGNACQGVWDQALLANGDIDGVLNDCVASFAGSEPGTLTCIEENGKPEAGPDAHLSTACAQCYDALLQCILASCALPCEAALTTTLCRGCQEEACRPAFTACSGQL